MHTCVRRHGVNVSVRFALRKLLAPRDRAQASKRGIKLAAMGVTCACVWVHVGVRARPANKQTEQRTTKQPHLSLLSPMHL
jgi:hypothetical protein